MSHLNIKQLCAIVGSVVISHMGFAAADSAAAVQATPAADRLTDAQAKQAALVVRNQFISAARAKGDVIAQARNLPRSERMVRYEQLSRELIEQFPTQADSYESLLALAEDQPDPVASARIVKDLLAFPSVPAGVKAWASALASRQAMLNQPLALTFYDASGKNHALSEYRGKPVILCAWASNNSASVALLGKLTELSSSTGVVVIGINLDLDQQKAKAALNAKIVEAYDSPAERGALAGQLKLTRLPAVYTIDGKGLLREIGKDVPSPASLVAQSKEGGV